ncbi:MAG: hypothetical protein Q8R92_16670 [Deltaproteobacteria bacterium]|nr:hypothetical protein [Deltaproteobacteria bacterium]
MAMGWFYATGDDGSGHKVFTLNLDGSVRNASPAYGWLLCVICAPGNQNIAVGYSGNQGFNDALNYILTLDGGVTWSAPVSLTHTVLPTDAMMHPAISTDGLWILFETAGKDGGVLCSPRGTLHRLNTTTGVLESIWYQIPSAGGHTFDAGALLGHGANVAWLNGKWLCRTARCQAGMMCPDAWGTTEIRTVSNDGLFTLADIGPCSGQFAGAQNILQAISFGIDSLGVSCWMGGGSSGIASKDGTGVYWNGVNNRFWGRPPSAAAGACYGAVLLSNGHTFHIFKTAFSTVTFYKTTDQGVSTTVVDTGAGAGSAGALCNHPQDGLTKFIMWQSFAWNGAGANRITIRRVSDYGLIADISGLVPLGFSHNMAAGLAEAFVPRQRFSAMTMRRSHGL